MEGVFAGTIATKSFQSLSEPNILKKSLESHSPLISCQQRSEGRRRRGGETNSFPRAWLQDFKNEFSRASHFGGI